MSVQAVCKGFRIALLKRTQTITLNHNTKVPTFCHCSSLRHLILQRGCTQWPLEPCSPTVSLKTATSLASDMTAFDDILPAREQEPVNLFAASLVSAFEDGDTPRSEVDLSAFSRASLGSSTSLDLDDSDDEYDCPGFPRKACHTLESLTLAKNMAFRDDCLVSLRRLKALQRIEWPGYTGKALFEHLATIKSLRHVNLSHCWNISGQRLTHLAGLESLSVLDLSRSSMIGDSELEHLTGMRALEHLSLSHCDLVSSDGLRHLVHVKTMRHLELAGLPKVSDEGLAHLSVLTALERIDLSKTKVTGTGFDALKSLPRLKALDLSCCQLVQDRGLAYLASLPALEQLALRSVMYEGQFFPRMPRTSALRQLDLSGTRHELMDQFVALLPALDALEHLNLCRCSGITDQGVELLSFLRTLTHLDLSHAQCVTPAGVSHLAGLSRLQCLSLSCCTNVTDAALPYVAKLPALTSLDLSGCFHLTAPAVDSLKQCCNALQRLNLDARSSFSAAAAKL